jgi:hypothetical protein
LDSTPELIIIKDKLNKKHKEYYKKSKDKDDNKKLSNLYKAFIKKYKKNKITLNSSVFGFLNNSK